MKIDTFNLKIVVTMATRTKRKLIALGYKYVSIWECQFLEDFKADPELNAFLHGLNLKRG